MSRNELKSRAFYWSQLLSAVVIGVIWLSCAPGSNAQAASRVEVIGNRRIATDTILSYINFRPGTVLDQFEVDKTLKTLFDTGLFEDVRIRRRGRTLQIVVKENAFINRIAFEKNNKVDDEQLLKVISSQENSPLSRVRVQADTRRILEVYSRVGRFGVRVDPKIIKLKSNQVNLIFEVNEGVKTKVKRISFIGNKAFTDRRLREVISTTESNFFSFIKSSDVYDPDRINVDKELLRRHYLNEGYADFRIISVSANFDRENNAFFISFTLDEGAEYTFGTLRTTSNTSDVDVRILTPEIEAKRGSVYRLRDVEKTLENMTIRLAESGYAFAQVHPAAIRNIGNRTIDINFNLEQGAKAYIERINISGNTRTRDYVIRREFDFSEGDPYNKILIDRAIRRLRFLNFFKAVDISRSQGSGPDRVILMVKVEEGPTADFKLSGTYNTKDGFGASAGINQRNFFGTGLQIGAKGSWNKTNTSFSASFTEPFFLGSRVSVGAKAFRSVSDQNEYNSYTSKNTGGSVRVSLPILEDLLAYVEPKVVYRQVRLPANLKNNRVSDGESSYAIKDSEGDIWTTSLAYGLVFNSLDSRIFPSEGFYGRIDQEVAGIPGKNKFIRSSAELSGYISPIEDFVIKAKVQGGHVAGYGDQPQPAILDTFFKGGEFVRGFKFKGLGPRDIKNIDRESLGGKLYYGGSLELIVPFFGLPNEYGLRLAAFADAGTLIRPTGRIDSSVDSLWTYDPLRTSVGVSVIWQSPVGPIRFDFSKVLRKGEFDEEQRFQFSGGAAF